MIGDRDSGVVPGETGAGSEAVRTFQQCHYAHA